MSRKPHEYDQGLASRIDQAARAIGTRAAAARAAQITPQHLHRLIAGASSPSAALLAKIAAAAGFTLDWLMTGEGERLRPGGKLVMPAAADVVAFDSQRSEVRDAYRREEPRIGAADDLFPADLQQGIGLLIQHGFFENFHGSNAPRDASFELLRRTAREVMVYDSEDWPTVAKAMVVAQRLAMDALSARSGAPE